MTGSLSFGVDLDLLGDTVAEMARCGDALDDVLDEVARRVVALQVTWSGAAARAQEGAQADWEAGFRQMREALASMRSAGLVAHGSYRDAAATNLRMWEQVS
jgi:WXG100 family type VII secretion target